MGCRGGALPAFLEGKQRNEEDHTKDIGQDAVPHDRNAPHSAGPGQPVPGVFNAGDGLSGGLSVGSASPYMTKCQKQSDFVQKNLYLGSNDRC